MSEERDKRLEDLAKYTEDVAEWGPYVVKREKTMTLDEAIKLLRQLHPLGHNSGEALRVLLDEQEKWASWVKMWHSAVQRAEAAEARAEAMRQRLLAAEDGVRESTQRAEAAEADLKNTSMVLADTEARLREVEGDARELRGLLFAAWKWVPAGALDEAIRSALPGRPVPLRPGGR